MTDVPRPNGYRNGNGNGGRLNAGYLALIIACGPVAGGGASWWFTKDADAMFTRTREERERAIENAEARFETRFRLMEEARKVQMDLYGERARDFETRLRALERELYRYRTTP